MNKVETTTPEPAHTAAENGAPDPASPEKTPPAPADTVRMPEPPGEPDQALQHQLRRFHFTGDVSGPGLNVALEGSLRPAVLSPWNEPSLMWDGFPLFISGATEDGATCTPVAALLKAALDEVASEEDIPVEAAEDHLRSLTRAIAGQLDARDGSGPFREILAAARQAFLAGVKESAAWRRRLDQLEEKLPGEGTLVGLGPHTLLDLYRGALTRYQEQVREEFRAEVRALLPQLEDLLLLERKHSADGTSPQSLSKSMGGAAGYLNAEALAQTLPPHRGSRHMDPARRRRVEEGLELLKHFLAGEKEQPAFLVVHSRDLPDGLQPASTPTVREPDSFAAAMRLFDSSADELLPLVRALRMARLEAAGDYDPALHDEALALLDREALTARELALGPAVLVLESVQALRGEALSSFSHLLHSGRPVHMLVLHHLGAGEAGEAGLLSEDRLPDLGYRSIAHREAYVLQSTLVQGDHLGQGLEELVRAGRPAVAFIGGRPWSEKEPLPWLQSLAEHQGRVTPCFRYAPGTAETWAAGFALSHNPQPEEAWPRYDLAWRREGGEGEGGLTLHLTFADYAALLPSCRPHFCVIPTEAWSDEHQLELSEYLEQLGSELPRALPFIWVLDDGGTLQRAVLTRELALACWDRMRSWRVLQELGGIHNEYALRAIERAQAEARKEIEALRAELEEAHAAELEKVRAQTVQDTINRLVAGLLGLDQAPSATLPPPGVERPPTGPATPAEAPAPAAEEAAAETTPAAEEEHAVEEPYIDSALCTTCDDCINLNPRMFKYNEDKQAYIADPTSGTFAELVKAAINCPAVCIHPGAPRPGDTTATPKLIAKAAEFN